MSLETFNYKPIDQADAQSKADELQKILEQLEEKEKTVQEIYTDCQEYGSQYGDVQRLIRELLFGLNSNINVIRENQNIIRANMDQLKETKQPEQPVQEVQVVQSEQPVIEQIIQPVQVEEKVIVQEIQSKPETQAMATQTTPDKPSTDNFMIIQSMGAEGETIQIYNMPHDDQREDDNNVTVEAKYVRGHGGEPMRTSELVLKNVPKHFETTFVEPDETTTEIIVDPDGTKSIIVRKLTKTTHKIVKKQLIDGTEIPGDLKTQLETGSATHDILVSSIDSTALEQHPEITESSLSAVIEHISHRVVKKTRRIIKKIIIIDGKEHITEEVIEEPDEIEEFEEDRPAIEYEVSQTVKQEPVVQKITEVTEILDDSQPVVIQEVKQDVEIVEEATPVVHEVEIEIKQETVTLEQTEAVSTEEIKSIQEEQVVQQNEPEPAKEPEPVIESEPLKEPEPIKEPEPVIEVEPVKEPEPVQEPEPTSEPPIVEELTTQEPTIEQVPPEIPEETPQIDTPADEPSGEQVFEIATEAPVDLIASKVDNLAPIENVEDIWPHSTPHITPQSALPVEMPAQTEKDKDSESIWPQNLTIGSNIDFNEYSFERTLEKSSDYLDNSSFTIVDAGIEEIIAESEDAPKDEEIVQPKIEEIDQTPKVDDKSKILEFIESEKYTTETVTEVPTITKEQEVLPEKVKAEPENGVLEVKSPEVVTEVIEKIKSPEVVTEVIEEIKSPEIVDDELLQVQPEEPKSEEIVVEQIISTEKKVVEEVHEAVEPKIEEVILEKSDSPVDDQPSEQFDVVTEEAMISIDKDETPEESQKTTPKEIQSPSKTAPVSPSTPQLATITIVKTMTFLEREKERANELIPEKIETRMYVKTPEPPTEIQNPTESIEPMSEEPKVEKPEIPEVTETVSQVVTETVTDVPEQDVKMPDPVPEIIETEVTETVIEKQEVQPEPPSQVDISTDEEVSVKEEISLKEEIPSEDAVPPKDEVDKPLSPEKSEVVDPAPEIPTPAEVSEVHSEPEQSQTIEKVEMVLEQTAVEISEPKEPTLSSEEAPKEEKLESEPSKEEDLSVEKVPEDSQNEEQPQKEPSEPLEPSESSITEEIKKPDVDTIQVVLKVDPSEVTKVNLNITEESSPSTTPVEQIESPPESIKTVEVVEHVQEPEKVLTDVSSVRSTGYEAEDKDDSLDSQGKKKKKKDKKKKQPIKPEEVPSAIPKSTDVSQARDASIISSDNEMPEEELLPEGREEILSPDESYRTMSEIEQQPVKILEENVITSPDESIISQPDTGIVYPAEVIEMTCVEDTEQQTEPVALADGQPAREIETKEIQTLEPERVEHETQMSPVVEKQFDFEPREAKPTSDSSMQTIIMKFIESESQTVQEEGEERPKQEQEIQTEQFTEDSSKDKQESSVQTIQIVTIEKVAQTEGIAPEEDQSRMIEEIVDEITTRAVEDVESQSKSKDTDPEEVSPEEVPTKEFPPKEVPPKEAVPVSTVSTQTKKSKKNKKQKSKDDQKTELEIETIVTQPDAKIEEKSHVSMTIAPETNVENIDVKIKLNITPQNESDTVLRRLNDIMNIETTEQQKENFTLSQNLNNLINSTDQHGFEMVPWSEVQYMIDTNIDNRRINNTNEFMTENIVDEPVDEKINESLQKIEQYINILPEVVNTNEERITQKTIIVITKVIVTCLEQIEYKIYKIKQNNQPTTEDVNELKRLEELLHALKQNVAPIENPDITRCIDTLQQHIDFDKEVQEDVNKDIRDFYTELNSADDIIKRLQQETIILEDRFHYILHTEFPNDNKMRELDSLEAACKENKKSALRAIKMKNLNDDQTNIVKSCYDKSKDMEHTSRLEKRKLIQLINLSEEYVQTLNEFSQITLIANSLVDKTIVTNSLDHLQNEIQRHRKFFINLNHCRNILESLERNLDPETREKHSELHNALYQKATNILEKAGDRSQKLALAASKWTVLDKRIKNEEQWLQVAEQRVPDLRSVTSADYEQYITLYQSLNSDLTMHQAKMVQNYETSIKLQELICAPNLETKCNDSLTKLVKIKEDVNTYLKRLLHFKQMWYEYNLNADKLEHWMNQVEDELNKIDIPENFMTYPVENMRNFWEIKAHYEVNNQIHKNVCENFDKSLKIISLADDKLQLQFYAQLDDRWQNITNRIDAIKSQITDNISSTAPSYNDKLLFLENELDEIMFIINNTKGIIRNPEELNLYIERLIVLKSRIVVVENELVTIGFISTSDTEKVGELCDKSHKISLCITEEMELADLCKGRLNTLRQEIGAIREDQVVFYERLADFEGAAKLESATIEKALEGCQLCRENLLAHWKDIMRVRHLLHTLPTGLRMSVSPVDVEKEISQLEDDYVDIEKRLCEIESMLKNRFALWKRFEKQLEIIQQSIQETDFMVELLTVHGNIDYDRLLKATERLEVR